MNAQTYTFQYGGDQYSITTDHAAASNDLPVLVDRNGNAYGYRDLLPAGPDELGWLNAMETAEQAAVVHLIGLKDAGQEIPAILAKFVAEADKYWHP